MVFFRTLEFWAVFWVVVDMSGYLATHWPPRVALHGWRTLGTCGSEHRLFSWQNMTLGFVPRSRREAIDIFVDVDAEIAVWKLVNFVVIAPYRTLYCVSVSFVGHPSGCIFGNFGGLPSF